MQRPIVGMASTPDGKGYWLVAADGGVFSFGDAGYFGSGQDSSNTSAVIGSTVSGMLALVSGKGYRLIGADGSVFDYGAAAYQGRVWNRLSLPAAPTPPCCSPQFSINIDGAIGNGSDADFAFLVTVGNGVPVKFNPCVPHHYVINVTQAPHWSGTDPLTLIQSAVGQFAAATGMQFVYDGTTDLGPPTPSGNARPLDQLEGPTGSIKPICIGWISPSQWPPFLGSTFIAGQEIPMGTYNQFGQALFFTGEVVLNSGITYESRDQWYSDVLHELGHLGGLAHVTHPEIMSPSSIYSFEQYQEGDMNGRNELGIASGCIPQQVS